MTETREGTVEMRTKIKGKYYALGIDLDICPTEEVLIRELSWLSQTLVNTLRELNWFSEKKEGEQS